MKGLFKQFVSLWASNNLTTALSFAVALIILLPCAGKCLSGTGNSGNSADAKPTVEALQRDLATLKVKVADIMIDTASNTSDLRELKDLNDEIQALRQRVNEINQRFDDVESNLQKAEATLKDFNKASGDAFRDFNKLVGESNTHMQAWQEATKTDVKTDIKVMKEDLNKDLITQNSYLQIALDRVYTVAENTMNYTDKAAIKAENKAADAASQARIEAQRAIDFSNDTKKTIEADTKGIDKQIADKIEKENANNRDVTKNLIIDSITTALSNAGVWMVVLSILMMIFIHLQNKKPKASDES